MRVTGGLARGQVLKVPRNVIIRPTTDRVREAIFSILGSLETYWNRCLDLYAGTGALGIEALSRGATWVDFVEKERRCCDIIKLNLDKLEFNARSRVYCYDVIRTMDILKEKYDLVFVDPPYADMSLESVLEQVGKADYMSEDSMTIVSHSSRVKLKENYGKIFLLKDKRYGDTAISIYRMEADN